MERRFFRHTSESICLTADRVLVLEQGQIKKCFAGQEIEAGTLTTGTIQYLTLPKEIRRKIIRVF